MRHLKMPVSLFMLIVFWVSGFSQWVDDPAQNTPVVVHSGEQTVPKLVATPDAGCYLAWYDNRDANYDVYLQRLNGNGEAQWADGGIAVSTHPQDSWVTDFDLAADDAGNAIVAFNDIRDGGDWDVYVYKIAPDGQFLWGADGISVSPANNSNFEAAPKIQVTSNGNVVVAWFTEESGQAIRMQMISPGGEKLWGTDGIMLDHATNKITDPILAAAANDSILVLYKNSSGNFPALTTRLHVQKIAPDGSLAWGDEGVQVYSFGQIPGFTIPSMIGDGNGGAWMMWEHRPSLSTFEVQVGHVAANGSLLIPLNGVTVSTDQSKLHLSPSIGRIETTNYAYVFWVQENYDQNQWGLAVQKLDADGSRLFGDSGKILRSLGSKPLGFPQIAGGVAHLFLSFFEASSSTAYDAAVYALGLNTKGNPIWSEGVISVAANGNKDDLLMVVNSNNQALVAWRDERNDSGDVFAQNVNSDGTMGLPNAISNPDRLPVSPLLLTNYPNPFNPETEVRFDLPQAGRVQLRIYDATGRLVRALLDEVRPSGANMVRWDSADNNGNGVASGNYFCLMTFAGKQRMVKMILIR